MRSLILTALLAMFAPAFGAPLSRPNVIVILTDDMGWADLAVQGAVKDVRTPHLDALAAAGVRCTSGYITSPQCSPSRAGLITGQHQQRFGIDTIPDVPLPSDAVTLAERLGPVGYRCGFVGKWHLEPNILCVNWMRRELPELADQPETQRRIPPAKLEPYTPAAQGFHDYFWGEMTRYRANFDLDGKDLAPGKRSFALPHEFRVDVQTRAAVAFIERNRSQPFYLHVGYFAPHTPLEAPQHYLDRFPGPMPERRRYALAMIAAVDDGVGAILAKLREHGLETNTLVMFTSDNGAPLKITRPDTPVGGDHGGWDGSVNDPWAGEKGMLSEGGIRVPMLFSWPGTLPSGKVYDAPVSSLDFAATAVAAAGLPHDPALDGVDLTPFFTGRATGQPHGTLCWRFWTQAAIRDGRWKYLSAGRLGEFLFDLSTPDPESRNLLKDHPDRAAELRRQLKAWTDQFQPPGIPEGEVNAQESAWYRHYFGSR